MSCIITNDDNNTNKKFNNTYINSRNIHNKKLILTY